MTPTFPFPIATNPSDSACATTREREPLPLERRFKLIVDAIYAQQADETLWSTGRNHTADHRTQSLRWLHAVAETGDLNAFEKIVKQQKGDI